MKFAYIAILSVMLSSILTTTSIAQASDGTVAMTALDGTEGKCRVYSIYTAQFEYPVTLSCRNQIYPPGDGLFQYIVWVQHAQDEFTKLGTLGVGRKVFTAPREFSRIFITKEPSGEVERPSDRVYMSGRILPDAFLENTGTNIDTVSTSPTVAPQVDSALDPDISEPNTNQAAPQIGNAVRILGGVVFFIVVVVVAIAFVSASRRKPVQL